MTVIEEGYIRFGFGESWTLVKKWDDSRDFRDGIHKLNGEVFDEDAGQTLRLGSKAVDIIGVRDDELYLMEVKDYRGHAIETRPIQPHDLPLLIGCKVRDTVAGLIGASRCARAPWIDRCVRLLAEPKRRVRVIAWIADPALRAREPAMKRSIWQKERSDSLKRRLSWLTPHVTVASPFDGRIPDVATESLKGAGLSPG